MNWFQTDTTKLLKVLERIATALEHGANRPEYRWTDADNKLNRVKALVTRWPHTAHGPFDGPCVACELGKVLET